jgi:hypothetical protein
VWEGWGREAPPYPDCPPYKSDAPTRTGNRCSLVSTAATHKL